MEYKRSIGMKFTTSFKTNAKAAWSAGTVIRILKNPIYTGVLVQGKETTPSYKVHKRITKGIEVKLEYTIDGEYKTYPDQQDRKTA